MTTAIYHVSKSQKYALSILASFGTFPLPSYTTPSTPKDVC